MASLQSFAKAQYDWRRDLIYGLPHQEVRDNVYSTPLACILGTLRLKSYFSHTASNTPLPTSFYGPSGAALVRYGPYLTIYLFC